MARDLTKEKVVAKAAELANALGDVQQLKLKDLASELNIKVPSLYNHVKGMDGLIFELRVYLLNSIYEQLRDAMAGQTGRDALMTAAREYRTFAHANPGIYPLIIPVANANSEAEIETIGKIGSNIISIFLLIFASFGLDGDDALHTVRGLRSLLHGFVSLELTGGFGLDLDLDQSFERLISTFVDGIR